MAGLNFQTQTIINKNVDPDSHAGSEWLFKGENDVLRVKRDFTFDKNNVKVIRKAEGHDATACKVTIDFSEVASALTWAEGETKKYCRLDIYLGVEGAEPYIYSTPWVQKGIPFWVEFTVKKPAGSTATSAEASAIAADVANAIKKNNLFVIDKDLLKVETNAAILTLTGNTEYQRFRKVEVLTFSVTDDDADVVATLGDDAIVLEERGENSFGTYSQIVKDLRLPTAANYQWTHVRQVETPIVGAIYNQYIIEYCAPAVNDGLHAVGQRMESHTTHVFWVNQDIASEWETALAAIDPEGEPSDEENTDPDNELDS